MCNASTIVFYIKVKVVYLLWSSLREQAAHVISLLHQDTNIDMCLVTRIFPWMKAVVICRGGLWESGIVCKNLMRTDNLYSLSEC